MKSELETFLLHCIIVAGKNAPFGNAKTKALLSNSGSLSPFEYIKSLIDQGLLLKTLKEARTGNYKKMESCLKAIIAANIKLETCSLGELESIPYIGLKTSRYFIMYTRLESETNDIAVIDIHTLRWCRNDSWAIQRFRELGIKVPKSTPSKNARNQYLLLQKVICEDAKRKGISSRTWDAQNWDEESNFSDLSRETILGQQ